ncbi:MAG: alanine racemase, partial [Gammaproteobacteria bacterium]|nr:alanine racemase [Gammaproteobacteria bacterium]
MSAPRLEINLDKLQHNARILVERLGTRGITVTGVTKAFLGNPVIASALLRAGVTSLGDSRIENIQTMRSANLAASMSLIRSPMPSQIDQVVAFTDLSFNTELAVIRLLSSAALKAKRIHGVILMVELGDLREGILPVDVDTIVPEIL